MIAGGVAESAFSWGTCVRDFAQGRAQALKDLPLTVKKSVQTVKGRREKIIRYHLTNASSRRLKFLFAAQTVLDLKDAHVNRMGEADGVRRFAVVDPIRRLQVSWALSRAARLWYFPLESGQGMRRTYQGVSLSYLWPLTLAPRGSWEVTFQMKMGPPNGQS